MDETNDTQDVDLENNEEAELAETPVDTDWEAQAKKAEAEAAKWRRIAERSAKKSEAPVEHAEKAPQKTTNPGEFDYGQRAYLAAKGLETPEAMALAKEIIGETGRELVDVVNSKYFAAELKERQETKASMEAVPKTTKRSASPIKDEAAYWVDKDFSEVPQNLRSQVLNLKIERERKEGQFSSNPLVLNG